MAARPRRNIDETSIPGSPGNAGAEILRRRTGHSLDDMTIDPFVTHRGLLFTAAYEMLGSAAASPGSGVAAGQLPENSAKSTAIVAARSRVDSGSGSWG